MSHYKQHIYFSNSIVFHANFSEKFIFLSAKLIYNLHVRSPWIDRPFPRLDCACKVYASFEQRRTTQPSDQTALAVTVTPGTFATQLRSVAHRAPRNPMEKPPTGSPVTPGTFATLFRWLVTTSTRSNHGTELTYRDEKNVCHFAILLEIFPVSNLSPHVSIFSADSIF